MTQNITGKDIKIELAKQGKTQTWLLKEVRKVDESLDNISNPYISRVVNDVILPKHSYKTRRVIQVASKVLGMIEADGRDEDNE